MNKTDKIIVIFYVFLAVSYTSSIIYTDFTIQRPIVPNLIPEAINEITFIKTVDTNKTKIFNVMGDIQNYPIILPKNIISVTIKNQTGNIIYAEEEVMEKFIKTKLLVKHTILTPDKQILEVIGGDAKGTIITETFEGNDSYTKLTINVKLHVEGVLAPVVFFSKPSLEQEMDKIIDSFVAYARGQP